MGHFTAFFSWSNLWVWCSSSLNWSKLRLPQSWPWLSDLFAIPMSTLMELGHLEADHCLVGVVFVRGRVLGFVCSLFMESALWSSAQCNCQVPAPCSGGDSGCAQGKGWREDDINLSVLQLDDLEVVFLITLTAGMNFWKKCDSTGQCNDCYCSFAFEKLMSPCWNFFSPLFISEDNLL